MAFARAKPTQLLPTDATTIAPIATGVPRPLISVVLPVYEPSGYLLDALRGILAQDLGTKEMQIAIVDDASSRDVAALVAQVAPPDRVEIYRAESNQGLAGNWNQCIRVARGKMVHILHQDDWVADGFYKRLLPVFANRANVGMAFCRYAIAEAGGQIARNSHRERWRAGVLRNWLERISERQRIQCASVVVRRSVYEQVGGYRTDLCYALDWEMWVRIAARFAVWFEPRRLAFYRRHNQSETERLAHGNNMDFDVLKAIDIFTRYCPAESREQLAQAAHAYFVHRSLKALAKKAPGAHLDIEQYLQPARIALEKMNSTSRRVGNYRKQLKSLARNRRAK